MGKYDPDKIVERNLQLTYNSKLKLEDLNSDFKRKCLNEIFKRDIRNNIDFKFREAQIFPCHSQGSTDDQFEILFTHLTTIKAENGHKRTYDKKRSERIHWIRYHIDENKKDKMLVFTYRDIKKVRTYIYDEEEKYLIVLQPYDDENIKSYYLITAYFCFYEFEIRSIYSKYSNRIIT